MHIWFPQVHQAALGTYIDPIRTQYTRVRPNFEVYVDMLQIFFCVQLTHSADWFVATHTGKNKHILQPSTYYPTVSNLNLIIT